MHKCKVDGCRKLQKARGWCSAHYARWRLHGSTEDRGTQNGAPRYFLENTIPAYIDKRSCLTWPFSTINGYGSVHLDGKTHLVHRLVCVSVNGPAPEGYQAAHSCGKGKFGCVSPHHIVWKTRADNEADKVLHGTSNRGERQGMSKLKEADVHSIRAMRGQKSQSEIAQKFDVSPSLVSMIQTGKAWGWLPVNNMEEALKKVELAGA